MTYPNTSGYKIEGTSQEAAQHMDTTGRSETLRQMVLVYLRSRSYSGSTPDNCAAALGESVLAIRPRFTELEQSGMIRKTKLTEKNESGRNAAVYLHAALYGKGN